MAAKCGHPAGQFEVGYYLFEGFGDVEQDYAKAVEWFEKAYQNPKCSVRPPGRRPPPTSVYAIRRAWEQFKTTMWHSSIFMKPGKTSTIYGSQ